MDEKKLQISFESNAFTKVGLFYVFSKYWLPIIIYGILSAVSILVAINFVSYIFSSSPNLLPDINKYFNSLSTENIILNPWNN